MGWLDRIEARASHAPATGRKGFTMPPFWADGAAIALGGGPIGPDELGGGSFDTFARDYFKGNSVVFSVFLARMRVFGQARFAWRRYVDGRPGELHTSPDLALFDRPWANGTSGEMLGRMELDTGLAGNNFYTLCDQTGRLGKAARANDGLFMARLRPDRVKILIDAPSGDVNGPDARIIGFSYTSPGRAGDPWFFLPEEVSHYSPIPDPEARYRGMSWLTPVIREVLADRAMTQHKTTFLRQGASPSMVVKMSDDLDDDEFTAFVAKFKAMYEGVNNAYKTIFVAGGADITPLTFNFKDLDLGNMQAKVETRIAMAGGVHPSILGSSEGLGGSALNAGNLGALRRIFVDANIRDLWNKAAASLETLVTVPAVGERLTTDDRDVAFLQDDADKEAAVREADSRTLKGLLESGYEPDAALEVIVTRDWGKLRGQHTGLLSVQLQDPNKKPDPPAVPPAPPVPPDPNNPPPAPPPGEGA
jgi:phage portal protein BeeE